MDFLQGIEEDDEDYVGGVFPKYRLYSGYPASENANVLVHHVLKEEVINAFVKQVEEDFMLYAFKEGFIHREITSEDLQNEDHLLSMMLSVERALKTILYASVHQLQSISSLYDDGFMVNDYDESPDDYYAVLNTAKSYITSCIEFLETWNTTFAHSLVYQAKQELEKPGSSSIATIHSVYIETVKPNGNNSRFSFGTDPSAFTDIESVSLPPFFAGGKDDYPVARLVKPVLYSDYIEVENSNAPARHVVKDVDEDFRNQVKVDLDLQDIIEGVLEDEFSEEDIAENPYYLSQILNCERAFTVRALFSVRQFQDILLLYTKGSIVYDENPEKYLQPLKIAKGELERMISFLGQWDTTTMSPLLEQLKKELELPGSSDLGVVRLTDSLLPESIENDDRLAFGLGGDSDTEDTVPAKPFHVLLREKYSHNKQERKPKPTADKKPSPDKKEKLPASGVAVGDLDDFHARRDREEVSREEEDEYIAAMNLEMEKKRSPMNDID